MRYIYCTHTSERGSIHHHLIITKDVPLIDIEEADDYDIAMLCPHLVHKVKDVEKNFTHPLYVIPPKLYGLMDPVAFLEDAEDAIELWKSGKTDSNWIRFEEEPVPMRIRRLTSHRRWLEARNNQ
jgi:PTS system cellobiose-specific IIB component